MSASLDTGMPVTRTFAGQMGDLLFNLFVKPIVSLKSAMCPRRKGYATPAELTTELITKLQKITPNIFSSKYVFTFAMPGGVSMVEYMWLLKTSAGVIVLNPDPNGVQAYDDSLKANGLDNIVCIVMVNFAHESGIHQWKAAYPSAACLVPQKHIMPEQYSEIAKRVCCDGTLLGTIEDHISNYGISIIPLAYRENMGIDYHWILPSEGPNGSGKFILFSKTIHRQGSDPDDTSSPLEPLPAIFIWVASLAEYKKVLVDMSQTKNLVGVGGFHFQGSTVDAEALKRALISMADALPVGGLGLSQHQYKSKFNQVFSSS